MCAGTYGKKNEVLAVPIFLDASISVPSRMPGKLIINNGRDLTFVEFISVMVRGSFVGLKDDVGQVVAEGGVCRGHNGRDKGARCAAVFVNVDAHHHQVVEGNPNSPQFTT